MAHNTDIDTDKSSEILPCPFCGGDARKYFIRHNQAPSIGVGVICLNDEVCGCEMVKFTNSEIIAKEIEVQNDLEVLRALKRCPKDGQRWDFKKTESIM